MNMIVRNATAKNVGRRDEGDRLFVNMVVRNICVGNVEERVCVNMVVRDIDAESVGEPEIYASIKY